MRLGVVVVKLLTIRGLCFFCFIRAAVFGEFEKKNQFSGKNSFFFRKKRLFTSYQQVFEPDFVKLYFFPKINSWNILDKIKKNWLSSGKTIYLCSKI
jgi:hypothetical protein